MFPLVGMPRIAAVAGELGARSRRNPPAGGELLSGEDSRSSGSGLRARLRAINSSTSPSSSDHGNGRLPFRGFFLFVPPRTVRGGDEDLARSVDFQSLFLCARTGKYASSSASSEITL